MSERKSTNEEAGLELFSVTTRSSRGRYAWVLVVVVVLGLVSVLWLARETATTVRDVTGRYDFDRAPSADSRSTDRPRSAPAPARPNVDAESPEEATVTEEKGIWSVKSEVDRLTDRVTVRAVAAVDENGRRYELALRCDSQARIVSLKTFDSTALGALPRPMPFELRQSGDDLHNVLTFRFRVDNGDVGTGVLLQQADWNHGVWLEQSGDYPIDVSPLSFALFGYGEPSSDDLKTMPSSRLVVADVFPDESVEFPFAAMSPADRSVVDPLCFPMHAHRERSHRTPSGQQDEQPPLSGDDRGQ